MKHKLTPRAFVELRTPHNPQVSPDGQRVVFEVHEPDFDEGRYVSRLWITDTAEARARQITFAWDSDHDAKWSPDGKHIAFVSTRPDLTQPPPPDEESQPPTEEIWVLPTDTGEAYRLTNTREGIRDFRWAPNGAAIIFLTSEARLQSMQFAHDDAIKRKVDPVVEHQQKLRRQFWVVTLEERKPELLYTGDFGISEFDVSPDGARLVFNTNYTGEPNDYHQFHLHLLDLESEEDPRRLTDRDASETQPRWSPDGSRIAFLSPLIPGLSYSQDCVWTVDAAGGSPSNMFGSAPYDAEEIVWSPRGEIFVSVAHRTTKPLVKISVDGEVSLLTGGNSISIEDIHIGPDGSIAAVVEDDQTVPEVCLFDQHGGQKPLTELGKEFLERFELPSIEVIRWQSDGGEIEGVLVRPPGAAECLSLPMVVQVHGGPKGHAQATLRSYYQHPVWAAEGYLVLQPNFRGSSGYGNDFAVSNRRDLGGCDFRDIMAGVDHVVDLGLADPARIGIMGGSYGGYMVNWAIGQTDRFAAAISQFGMFSLVTSTANSDLSRWELEYLGAQYWEDPEIYRRCSPASSLGQISTPVLIIHGQGDTNTFISNSKEMYQALRARGAAVEFVHYPREGHGLREPSHRLDEMRRCFAWFDRYLKGGGKSHRYRLGDLIEHNGYELLLLRAEDIDFGWDDDPLAPRLLEVAITLASRDPAGSYLLFLDDVALRLLTGEPCPLRGVPTDFGGGRSLVEGKDLSIIVPPDRDTGRIGAAPLLVFEIPQAGGEFELCLADFPPIEVVIGPKEEKPAPEEFGEPDEGDSEDLADPIDALSAIEPIEAPQGPGAEA